MLSATSFFLLTVEGCLWFHLNFKVVFLSLWIGVLWFLVEVSLNLYMNILIISVLLIHEHEIHFYLLLSYSIYSVMFKIFYLLFWEFQIMYFDIYLWNSSKIDPTPYLPNFVSSLENNPLAMICAAYILLDVEPGACLWRDCPSYNLPGATPLKENEFLLQGSAVTPLIKVKILWLLSCTVSLVASVLWWGDWLLCSVMICDYWVKMPLIATCGYCFCNFNEFIYWFQQFW